MCVELLDVVWNSLIMIYDWCETFTLQKRNMLLYVWLVWSIY